MSKSDIESIIRNAYINTYFQPIVSLNSKSILGYEALSRGPKNSAYFMPKPLIAEARAHNKLADLDHTFRKMIFVNATKQEIRKPLFINIEPSVLLTDKSTDSLIERCKEYGLSPSRIVIEISEQTAYFAFGKFRNILDKLAENNFSIAIDGINCTIADINNFTMIKPRYIKISGELIHDIDKTPTQEKIDEIHSIVTIAKAIGAQVIAVCVETYEELSTLYDMGIDAVQGNFLAPADKTIKDLSSQAEFQLSKLIN